MNDALKRAARTFAQGFVGSLLTSNIAAGFGSDTALDLSQLQRLTIGAIAAGVMALLSWAQNSLESAGAIKTVLK